LYTGASGFYLQSAGRDLILDTSGTTAVTIDNSTQNATFAGAVKAYGNSDTVAGLEIYSNSTHGMRILHRATDGDFSFERRVGGTNTEFLRIGRSTGNAVFAGNINTSHITNGTSGTLLLGSFNMTDSDEWPRIRWGYDSASNSWDEGLIKHSSSRGKFGQQGFGVHHGSARSFGIFTSGWTTQQEWKGDGSIYMRGDTGIGGTPSSGRRLQVWSNATIHSASYSWGEGLRIISDGNTNWAKIDFGTTDASNGSGILWGVAKSGTTGTNLTTSDFIIDYRNWSGSALGRSATVLQLSAGTGYVSTGDHLGVNGYASGTYALKVNGKIYATDDVIAFSDISSKTNFEPIENPLEKIDSISGYTYNKKGDESRRYTGMVAQEVEGVLPEAVYTNTDGTKGLAYQNTIGLLVEAIKELKTELNTLKQEMN